MQITESTIEKTRSRLLMALIGGLGVVCTSILKQASKPFADHVVPAIGSANMLWLSLLLLLTTLVCGTWLLFLIFGDKVERTRRKYLHLQTRGFWIHRKTSQRVCGNCLIIGIESPLACFAFHSSSGALHRNAWVCGKKECNNEYFYEQGDLDEGTLSIRPTPL